MSIITVNSWKMNLKAWINNPGSPRICEHEPGRSIMPAAAINSFWLAAAVVQVSKPV